MNPGIQVGAKDRHDVGGRRGQCVAAALPVGGAGSAAILSGWVTAFKTARDVVGASCSVAEGVHREYSRVVVGDTDE